MKLSDECPRFNANKYPAAVARDLFDYRIPSMHRRKYLGFSANLLAPWWLFFVCIVKIIDWRVSVGKWHAGRCNGRGRDGFKDAAVRTTCSHVVGYVKDETHARVSPRARALCEMIARWHWHSSHRERERNAAVDLFIECTCSRAFALCK